MKNNQPSLKAHNSEIKKAILLMTDNEVKEFELNVVSVLEQAIDASFDRRHALDPLHFQRRHARDGQKHVMRQGSFTGSTIVGHSASINRCVEL